MPAAHRLAQDDIGGPVLCAMPFEDEDHAIELAHATRCLPAAGVWTCDGERQLRMARRLRSGQVFINHSGAGRGVELPFDENQSSGDGRNAGMETSTASPGARPWPCATADTARSTCGPWSLGLFRAGHRSPTKNFHAPESPAPANPAIRAGSSTKAMNAKMVCGTSKPNCTTASRLTENPCAMAAFAPQARPSTTCGCA